MVAIRQDGSDHPYVEVPNGLEDGAIRLTYVREAGVSPVIRIQQCEEHGLAPGPEIAVAEVPPFLEALTHLLGKTI